LKEESLLTGPLEPTNESYAIAKIAGIKLCQAYRKQYGCRFIAAMPTNLYGPAITSTSRIHTSRGADPQILRCQAAGAPTVEVWARRTAAGVLPRG